MSDIASKRRKFLRAHLISPAPIAAGLGLLAAGVECADAATQNLDVVIGYAGEYQYATVPGTHVAGNILGPGETMVTTTATGSHGFALFTPGGNILYALNECAAAPAPGATDTLQYHTNQTNGIAQVTFVVPAVDDNYSTLEGIGVSFDVESNDNLPTLANATATLGLVGHTNPAHGTLIPGSNGQFQYVPNPGFVGTDTFTYTLDTAGFGCIGAAPTPPMVAATATHASSIQAVPQAIAGDPATALVTIRVSAPAQAPATNAVGLGLLASLFAWLGLRRRRES